MDDFVKGPALLRGQFMIGCAIARVISMCVLEREVLADVNEVIRVESFLVVGVVSACATD